MKIILLLLATWVTSSFFINLNKMFLPDAFIFFEVLLKELSNGNIIINLLATFQRFFLGLSIGSILGVSIGILLGISEKARKEIMPLIDFIRGIPTSMLFPVFIVTLGIGELSKTVIIASATFPIILVSAVVGCMPRVETRDRHDYLLVHANKLSWFTKLIAIIWDALPPIVSGLKVAISIALVLTIVTEMFFVASSGVGWAAHQAYLSFNLELMYCYVIVVGLLGVTLNTAFDYLYSHVTNSFNK